MEKLQQIVNTQDVNLIMNVIAELLFSEIFQNLYIPKEDSPKTKMFKATIGNLLQNCLPMIKQAAYSCNVNYIISYIYQLKDLVNIEYQKFLEDTQNMVSVDGEIVSLYHIYDNGHFRLLEPANNKDKKIIEKLY